MVFLFFSIGKMSAKSDANVLERLSSFWKSLSRSPQFCSSMALFMVSTHSEVVLSSGWCGSNGKEEIIAGRFRKDTKRGNKRISPDTTGGNLCIVNGAEKMR